MTVKLEVKKASEVGFDSLSAAEKASVAVTTRMSEKWIEPRLEGLRLGIKAATIEAAKELQDMDGIEGARGTAALSTTMSLAASALSNATALGVVGVFKALYAQTEALKMSDSIGQSGVNGMASSVIANIMAPAIVEGLTQHVSKVDGVDNWDLLLWRSVTEGLKDHMNRGMIEIALRNDEEDAKPTTH